MAAKWRRYTPDEVKALVATNDVAVTNQAELRCPVCDKRAVRTYYYERAGRRLVGLYYTWCASCHRYDSGQVAPSSLEYDFDDPFRHLSEDERLRIEEGDEWLDRLDGMWDSGKLPQTFTAKRR